MSVAAATARIVAGFALVALSFLFLTLFARRGGLAGFVAAPIARPDAEGGVDLMRGLDLADAAARAREALRETADAAPAPTPTPSDGGGASESSASGAEADDTEDSEREAPWIDPDPREEASSETERDPAPREEL